MQRPLILLILLALLGGGSLVVASIVSARKKSGRRMALLERVLLSCNHREIDDFLMIHGDKIPRKLRRQVEARRDDLYLERHSGRCP